MSQYMIYILSALSCLLGSVVQSITGFGFGIVVVSLMSFFMPSYGLVLSLSNILSFFTSVFVAVRLYRKLQWRLVFPLIIAFTVSNSVTVWISHLQPDQLLRRALGVFMILLGLYFAFLSKKLRIRPTALNGVISGLLGGALNGLFGMGGPPVVIYLLAASEDDGHYMANMQMYLTITNLIGVINRLINGQLTMEAVPYSILCVAMVIIGVRIGLFLFRMVNAENLKKLIYIMISLSGVALLLR